ncbi:uncharacterized protein LOC107370787 [Tetranychus urticae]|uniref:uncharacterized protein LOC107370787 n=1 Tax=Tetranychus urticae TaxID=32264 RepID=UPI00077BD633|nr:uncharacterized protein LOC107370787 [Tetranychus urticae]
MATIEMKANIKLLVSQKRTNKEIQEQLARNFPDLNPSKTTINRWIREFRCGRESLENQTQREGVVQIDYPRLLAAVSADLKADKKLSIRQLADKHRTSTQTMHNVVTNLLGKKKLTPVKVPHTLNISQKESRVKCSEAMLKLYNRGKRDFIENLFTMDETWLSIYDPESRTESMEWVSDRSELSQVATSDRRDPKVMTCVYWYSGGILKFFWCNQGTTINGEIYREQLKDIE